MFECRNIRKSFGAIDVLDGVNLALKPGARVGLSGGNGAGKSTLINIATGFVEADSGDARLDGKSYRGLAPWRIARRGIRRTFQSVRMQPSAPLGAQLHDPASDPQTRAGMLRDSGVAAYLHRFPAEAPAPVLRKAEVVRALLANPRVLFLDEPSAGLDAEEQISLGAFLNRWTAPSLVLVVVEHRRDLMDMTVNQLFELQNGRLFERTPELKKRDLRNGESRV